MFADVAKAYREAGPASGPPDVVTWNAEVSTRPCPETRAVCACSLLVLVQSRGCLCQERTVVEPWMPAQRGVESTLQFTAAGADLDAVLQLWKLHIFQCASDGQCAPLLSAGTLGTYACVRVRMAARV